MKPIELLMIEHRLIERAVEQIRIKAKDCKVDSFCFVEFTQLIDFLSSYSDLCHHGKEEKILFIECESKGLTVALNNLMEQLKLDHVKFRKMQEKMSILNEEFTKGNFSNLPKLNPLIEDFYSALNKHVHEEDSTFFPQSMKYFSSKEQEAMLKKFREFDQAIMHEKYRQLITELEAKTDSGAI
ncbi:MAG: hemerythrin domain-containing protein [Candidatus Omnitrophota bacterium]